MKSPLLVKIEPSPNDPKSDHLTTRTLQLEEKHLKVCYAKYSFFAFFHKVNLETSTFWCENFFRWKMFVDWWTVK